MLSEFVLALTNESPAALAPEVPVGLLMYFVDNLPDRYDRETKVLLSAGGPDGGPLVRAANPGRDILQTFRKLLTRRAMQEGVSI